MRDYTAMVRNTFEMRHVCQVKGSPQARDGRGSAEEYWVLWNDGYVDCAIGVLINQFVPDAAVVVVLDSCHSDNSTYLVPADLTLDVLGGEVWRDTASGEIQAAAPQATSRDCRRPVAELPGCRPRHLRGAGVGTGRRGC
jgi:hypothetical protein